MMTSMEDLIERIQMGETAASEELVPLVYNELRSLASKRLAQEAAGSLDTTDLVHEAYLRLVGSNQKWEGKRHFFGAAAEAMRRVLVDRARRRQRVKHGGQLKRIDLHDSAMEGQSSAEEILVVHDLFDRFAEQNATEAEVARLRYFAGLNLSEIAQLLGISVGSAHKYWKFAKAWLYRELQEK